MILKSIGLFLGRILLGCNAIVATLMICCAFSSYINPVSFPILSCAGLAFPIFLLLNFLFLAFWLFFYRRYALLPLVTMIICFGQIRAYIPINLSMTQIPDDAIKVLSYNIMHFDGHKPHSKNKPNEIVQYIQKTNADIVCLQECEYLQPLAKYHVTESQIDSLKTRYPYRVIGHHGQATLSKYPFTNINLGLSRLYSGDIIAHLVEMNNRTITLFNVHLRSLRFNQDDRDAYLELTGKASQCRDCGGGGCPRAPLSQTRV